MVFKSELKLKTSRPSKTSLLEYSLIFDIHMLNLIVFIIVLNESIGPTPGTEGEGRV